MANESKEYALIKMQLETLAAGIGDISNMLLDTERKMSSLSDAISGFDKESMKIGKEIRAEGQREARRCVIAKQEQGCKEG